MDIIFFFTTIKPPIKSKISLLVGLEPMYTARWRTETSQAVSSKKGNTKYRHLSYTTKSLGKQFLSIKVAANKDTVKSDYNAALAEKP